MSPGFRPGLLVCGLRDRLWKRVVGIKAPGGSRGTPGANTTSCPNAQTLFVRERIAPVAQSAAGLGRRRHEGGDHLPAGVTSLKSSVFVSSFTSCTSFDAELYSAGTIDSRMSTIGPSGMSFFFWPTTFEPVISMR